MPHGTLQVLLPWSSLIFSSLCQSGQINEKNEYSLPFEILLFLQGPVQMPILHEGSLSYVSFFMHS